MSTATVAFTRASVYALLLRNQEALERAVLAIQARQTADEQQQGVTRYQNGMGWNGRDASKGGSLAQWINNGVKPRSEGGYGKRIGTTLTAGQRVLALRMIRKYTAQLLAVAEAQGRAVDYDSKEEMAPPPGYSDRRSQPAPQTSDDDSDPWLEGDDEVGF